MTPRTELDRLFADSLAKIPKPENPMKIDLGHPLQDHDEPKPFDEPKFTPQERDEIVLMTLELQRKRMEANKRDADQELTKLGVVFTDGDAA